MVYDVLTIRGWLDWAHCFHFHSFICSHPSSNASSFKDNFIDAYSCPIRQQKTKEKKSTTRIYDLIYKASKHPDGYVTSQPSIGTANLDNELNINWNVNNHRRMACVPEPKIKTLQALLNPLEPINIIEDTIREPKHVQIANKIFVVSTYAP